MEENQQRARRCVVNRSDKTYLSKQGFVCHSGISKETAGSRCLCLHKVRLSPGAVEKAHLHRDHETAIYIVSGKAELRYGDRLQHHETVSAGEFLYIPANVPHLPRNASSTEDCIVVLDPNLPLERQQAICGQCGARLFLVQERYIDLAKRLAGAQAKVICIEEGGAMASESGLGLGVDVRPDDLCWIVYTSGSTGEPKGVAQNHRSMLHDMRTYVEGFHIAREDRLSLLMSLTTMAGCFGALMALGNGATLCRIDVQGRGIDHMAGEVARHRLTIWGGVASLFRQWMSALREAYPDLRIAWFGGEAVQARDFELYKAKLPRSCVFVNRLGSTETGCTRMYYADHDTRLSAAAVPVGYEVEGQEVYLEDGRGNRLAGAGTGEVVVASRYISVGYWRRADLTRSSFSEMEDAAGRRVFRTGDWARREEDGCLVYLGRKDHQVKIRGHRVELAEVEATLPMVFDFPTLGSLAQAIEEGRASRG